MRESTIASGPGRNRHRKGVIGLIAMILMTVLLLLIGAAGRIAPVWVLTAVCLLGFLPALAWVVWRYRRWAPPPTDAHMVKEQSLWSRLVMGAVPVAFIASPLRGEWLVFLIAAEGAVCGVFAGIVAMHRER